MRLAIHSGLGPGSGAAVVADGFLRGELAGVINIIGALGKEEHDDLLAVGLLVETIRVERGLPLGPVAVG